MGFFASLRIIELATVLAGPAVGQFFAELGAHVLKIENPKTHGDVTRGWKLPTEDEKSSLSAYFVSTNWGKKSCCLDISSLAEREKLYELVRTADVVIANYKAGDAEKLGVDYATLQSLNPSLIYGHITGYGLESKKVGYDALIQAEAGFMYMNGHANGEPTKMPVALIDLLAAHQLKEGLLVALLLREKTGKGAYVHVSLYEAAIASLANQASNWLNAQHLPERIGNEHPNIVPYGTLFTTNDGSQIILAVGSDKQFAQLCALLQLPDLANQFPTNALRVQNRNRVIMALAEAILRWEKKLLLDELEKNAIPAGAVQTLKEVFQEPSAQKLLWHDAQTGLKGVRSFVAQISSLPSLPSLSPPPPLR